MSAATVARPLRTHRAWKVGGGEASLPGTDDIPSLFVLHAPPGDERGSHLIHCGALTYAPEDARELADRLVEAADIAEGRVPGSPPPSWADTAVREPGWKPIRGCDLTLRHLQCAELAAQGCTNIDIAKRLTLSPHTVKTQLADALNRAGARDRAHLAAVCLRNGWIR